MAIAAEYFSSIAAPTTFGAIRLHSSHHSRVGMTPGGGWGSSDGKGMDGPAEMLVDFRILWYLPTPTFSNLSTTETIQVG